MKRIEWTENPTAKIQAACDEGGEWLVPYVGTPWIVDPIWMRRSVKLRLSPGVVLQASEGGYPNNDDCLLSIEHATNAHLVGHGATLKMRGAHYYIGEHRHCIRVRGATGVSIAGVTARGAGGDGVYIGRNISNGKPSEGIMVSNVDCADNRRNGMSVTSARTVSITGCRFGGDASTAPHSGLCIEPNHPEDPAYGIRVSESFFYDSPGPGILVALHHMTDASPEVSISFVDCFVDGCAWTRESLTGLHLRVPNTLPKGLAIFERVNVENSGPPPKERNSPLWRFVDCTNSYSQVIPERVVRHVDAITSDNPIGDG